MATKAIAVAVAFAVLLSITSAQEYSIRANRGLNLRAEPSLNADIADTVRSGTILQVVGKFNRWLKINRNGREVWLGDWVDYSRVDSVEATGLQPQQPPAPTATIDNCCYVDRHCHSDLDWMGGWHAFQNGQCAAPAQPQPATPAQPVASVPANVDNCCYVDRHCQSDLEWMGGWHAFRAGQCAAPGQAQTVASSRHGGAISRTASGIVIGYPSGNGILPTTEPYYWRAIGDRWSTDSCCDHSWQCNSHQDRVEGFRVYQTNLPNVYCPLPGLISIVGDPDFVSYYEQRLVQLSRLPQRYAYVLEGLNKIEQIRNNPRGTHVDIIDRIYFVMWGGPGSNARATRDTAVLVREACRVHAYDAKVRLYRFNQEAYNRTDAMCREMESAALHELGGAPN